MSNLLKDGQIWREVDPRVVRHVRIEGVGPGRRGVSLRTVEKVDEHWQEVRFSRLSYTDAERFDGRRGGYRYVEQ